MLIPIGSDYKRQRFPKATLGIIIFCSIVYVLIFWAEQVYGVLAAPAAFKLQTLEYPLMMQYLEQQGIEDPSREFSRKQYRPLEWQNFEKKFREAMKQGEVVPISSDSFLEWERALDKFEIAKRRDPVYQLGYVPADPGIVSLFTHMFLHGGFWHIFGNMIFLWLSGTSLEDVWGRKYYLAVFISGGVAAAVSHHIVNAGSYIPSIGASGAIAALMGAYTIRFATTRLRFVFFQWSFWVPAWILLPLWFSREVYYAIKFWGEFTGVATWAHIGGYLFGVAAALVLTKIGAEEGFIARSLTEQDKKDQEKARIRQEKKAGPRPRSKEVEKGIEARQLGEHQNAKQWFYAALEAAPEDLEAREELIRLHTQLGERPETAKQMGAMVGHFLEKGDRETALSWYNEIVRQNLYSHSIGAWTFDIAQELAKMGAWEAAAVNYANFARVCGQDPRAPKSLFSAGNIYTDRLNKFPEAVEVFNQILTCFPAWMPDEVKACRDRAQRMVTPG